MPESLQPQPLEQGALKEVTIPAAFAKPFGLWLEKTIGPRIETIQTHLLAIEHANQTPGYQQLIKSMRDSFAYVPTIINGFLNADKVKLVLSKKEGGWDLEFEGPTQKPANAQPYTVPPRFLKETLNGEDARRFAEAFSHRMAHSIVHVIGYSELMPSLYPSDVTQQHVPEMHQEAMKLYKSIEPVTKATLQIALVKSKSGDIMIKTKRKRVLGKGIL